MNWGLRADAVRALRIEVIMELVVVPGTELTLSLFYYFAEGCKLLRAFLRSLGRDDDGLQPAISVADLTCVSQPQEDLLIGEPGQASATRVVLEYISMVWRRACCLGRGCHWRWFLSRVLGAD